MEQRDVIKDQIEQLGKVLAKMLSDFLGLNSSGTAAQRIEISNERFQNELDIDIEALIKLNTTELTDYIKNQKMTGEHLEILSEYLKEIGILKIQTHQNEAKQYLITAIELLSLADTLLQTASFERINKKGKIETLLQQNMLD